MNKSPILYMLMLGGKPQGCHTEQHDVMFTIADNFLGTEMETRSFSKLIWPTVEKIHIDAYREVKNVEGYRISLVPKGTKTEGNKKLFFINLGGYKPNVFDEFHYRTLVVAENLGEAKKIAKESSFCLHHPATSSNNHPHVDDEYGVDVDDWYNVEDILPTSLKAQYSISISDVLFKDLQEDPIVNGYQRYEKLKNK